MLRPAPDHFIVSTALAKYRLDLTELFYLALHREQVCCFERFTRVVGNEVLLAINLHEGDVKAQIHRLDHETIDVGLALNLFQFEFHRASHEAAL